MTAYHEDEFSLRFDSFYFDNWGILPVVDYNPRADATQRLGARLPEDWDESYRSVYRVEFQPSRFYRNCALLTNLARKSNEDIRRQCELLFLELRNSLMQNSIALGDAQFIVNNFDFNRYGHALPSGWSGGIMNAFAIAGLMKAQQAFPSHRNKELARRFSEAFTHIHSGGTPRERWISLVDEDGYLWFEEYPLPNGTGCRVQNGHNFCIFALATYYRVTRDDDIKGLIDAGLTTIKANALRFRRPKDVPVYDLMPKPKPDYAPFRAVKQAGQLFALTGDEHFRGLAYVLIQDLRDLGMDVPEWATAPLTEAD